MFKYFIKNNNNYYQDFFKFKIFKYSYSNKNNKFNEVSNQHMHNLVKVGETRHYPPAVREWNDSVYSFNKNNQSDSVVKYNTLDKLIKSYFNLHNDLKLARSKRMRYLRIKSKSRKLYISRPEVKQTNDKIIISIYYFDKLKHNFTRKNFFFNRPSIVNHILDKKLKKRLLLKKIKFMEKRIKYSGIKQIKELKLFNNNNKFKNKYIEQFVWFYLFKYILSLINIQVYNHISYPSNIMDELDRLIFIINLNPKAILWIDFNNYSLEIINNKNINLTYLKTKLINSYNNINYVNNNLLLSFVTEMNKKLLTVIKTYSVKNVLSESILLKMYNYISIRVHRNIAKKIFDNQYNKISKLTYLSMNNTLKFKEILPALKITIDTLYNKKIQLNMVNLKYFFLNSDIFTQAIITKMKKKISPIKVLKKSLNKVKLFLNSNEKKRVTLNSIHKLYKHSNLYIHSFPIKLVLNKYNKTKDLLQTIFDGLYPHNLMYKITNNKFNNFYKITNILNSVKYKGILGVRVEAKGRLTRRHKAARAIMHLSYKGNLKDNDVYYNKEQDFLINKTTMLLRNDVRANTQYTYKGSIRRIGAFGLKAWVSGK